MLLKVIDAHWMNHIDDMEQLRRGIGLTAYGAGSKVEYRMVGYQMFEEMTNHIRRIHCASCIASVLSRRRSEEQAQATVRTKKRRRRRSLSRENKKILMTRARAAPKYKNRHGRPGSLPPLKDAD